MPVFRCVGTVFTMRSDTAPVLGQCFIPPGCCRTCLEEAGSLEFRSSLLPGEIGGRVLRVVCPAIAANYLGAPLQKLVLWGGGQKRGGNRCNLYIITLPRKKKKGRKEKRKCFSYLKSTLELNRDVPDVLCDLMLVAIDFTGL